MTNPTPQFLVVAAPDSSQARELSEALNQNGWPTALATTPEHLVVPFIAMLVILTPTAQTQPVIQAAMEITGPRRIPLFAEPMVLPYGEWASAPVLLGTNREDNLRAVLAAAIGAYPQPATVLAAPPLINTRQRELPAILGIGGLLLSIIVVVAGIVAVNARPRANNQGVIPTPTPLPTYTTNTPGLNCDGGTAIWHKFQNVQITCQAEGTLLSTPKDIGLLQGTSFEPKSEGIPQDYRVGVQATIITGDKNMTVFLDVHQQLPYGSQVFAARADGEWFIYRINDQGKIAAYLARGSYTPPATTLTLQVEVHGGSMLYTLNGQQVSSVTDTTYLTSHILAIGIFDNNRTTLYSALFTRFVYAPLP